MGSLFDDVIGQMIGQTLLSVALSADKEIVTFEFEGGLTTVFGVDGSCCSRSWIEHLTVPNDVQGAVLLAVEEGASVEQEHPDHECLQVYQTVFRTTRGAVILEYRNSSNGYYGGYLVALPPSTVRS